MITITTNSYSDLHSEHIKQHMLYLKDKEAYNSALIILQTQYLQKAREINVPYELETFQLETIIRKPCIACKRPPCTPLFKNRFRNEIELASFSLGFIVGNVYPICKVCKIIKGTHNFTQLERLATLHANVKRLINKQGKPRGAKSTHTKRIPRRRKKTAKRSR